MSRRALVLSLLSLAGSAALFLHTMLDDDGWALRGRTRGSVLALDAELESSEARANELRSQIDALRSRPEVQEHVVRDELGYVRPGDLVLELDRR